MAAPVLIQSLFLVAATPLALACISRKETISIYELLEKQGFPSGLLPNTVQTYTLDSRSGRIVVHLKKTCNVWVEEYSYSICYKRTITGILSYGSLSHLHGIAINNNYLIWWPITSVSLIHNGDLAFDVGPLSNTFPRSDFQNKPRCQQVHNDELDGKLKL